MLLVLIMVFCTVAPVVGYAASATQPEPAKTEAKEPTTVRDYDYEWFRIEQLNHSDGTREIVVTLTPDIEALLEDVKNLDKAMIKELLTKVIAKAKDFVYDKVNGQLTDGKIAEYIEIYEEWLLDDSVELPAALLDLANSVVDKLVAEKTNELFNAFNDVKVEDYISYGPEALNEFKKALNDKADEFVADSDSYVVEIIGNYYVKALIAELDEDNTDLNPSVADLTANNFAKLRAILVQVNAENTPLFEAAKSELLDNLNVSSIVGDVGMKEVLLTAVQAVRYVSIDGEVIYSNDGKMVVNPTALKNLVLGLPRPSEIAHMADEDMKLSYPIVLSTDLGDFTVTLTAKLGGGYDEVRTIARIIADHIDIQYVNGVIDLDVTVPERFSELLLRAANSDKISDALKRKVFAAFMADGNDFYALYQDLTFEDVQQLVAAIDFNGFFNKESIKQYVDLTGYSNEDIQRIVARFEKYFNVAKHYADIVLEKVVARIPDKYMDNSILSVFEHQDPNDRFEYSNGHFGYEGEHTVTADMMNTLIDKALAKFDSKFPEYTKYVIYALELVPENYIRDYTIRLDIDVDVAGINKVQYYDENGKLIREGLLPKGADLAFFANYVPKGEGFLGWFDENGTQYIKMPDHDVKLYVTFEEPDDPIIPKTVIDLSQFALTVYNGEPIVMYNGEEWTATLAGTNLDKLNITFTTDSVFKATNAGKYSVKVESVEYDTELYEVKGLDTEWKWQILPELIDVSELTYAWSTDNSFVYDPAATRNVTLSLTNFTDKGITVQYTGDVDKTDAGNYETFAKLVCDANHEFEIGDVYASEYTLPESKTWTITQKVITTDDLSGITWEYDTLNTPVYNNGDYTIVIDETTLPLGAVVDYYDGNVAKNAGNYEATVYVKAANGNYAIADGATAPTLAWSIAKAELDASSLKLQDTTFTYNGAAHSIFVTGDEDVLAMFEITYSGNAQKLCGTYTVKAKLTLKSEYAVNYNYTGKTLLEGKITITGEPKYNHEITEDGNVIVKVESVNGLDADHFINGGIIDVDSHYRVDGKRVEVLVAYDIYFTEGARIVSVDGKTFKVQLLIPEEYRGIKDRYFKVIHIGTNGDVEFIDAERDGDYMIFETNHFSVYAIGKTANLTWLWIILAIILVAGIAVAVYFFLLKKKETTAPTPDEIPEVEAAPVEEAPTEEAPAEEEVPAVDEEEPVVDEVAEEEPEEDIPAVDEEPVAIDEEPVAVEEEEPVVEEEPATEEEPVVDETEEAPVEEAPVEEAPVEEAPRSAVLVMGEDGKEATAVIGGETVHIRFRSSFMSRLIQSSEKVQSYYSAIKNHILSYKGIKARGSWNYEAFNKGRLQCVKLNIKGKTIVVNLNLDPAEYNINKYHFLDMSGKPKYAKVPMMMKVRSDRALKYTLELIDEMMKKLEIPQLEIPTVDYSMPYETTESLARRGLVKVILPAGVTLSDDMNIVIMNVTELIESGTTTKTTEQIIADEVPATEETPVEEAPVAEAPVEEAPVEEAPVEEAPVEETPVEEAPVEEAPVEEAPVEEAPVEEAPVEETPVEETPVEEAPVVEETPVTDEVHVDAITADQLITDEEAEAKIEIVHTGANQRSGKMGEINLDVICENFEDGDVVDVEALKAKRLISAKIVRVKVLARGVMTKKLTVVASKFSLQAVKMITLAGGKAEIED